MNIIAPIYGAKSKSVLKHNDLIAKLKKKLKLGQSRLTKSQQTSLTYHSDLIKIIPRAEITNHIKFIQNIVPTAQIAGSYRRKCASSSDIDIVIRESIPGVIERMTKTGYIKSIISAGHKKFSAVVLLPNTKIHRHIDVIFATPRSYPFAMLYFTGSKKFNIVMRLRAKQKGWKLNEYGLWDGMRIIPNINTERDIFKILKIPYVNPEDR
jgi:DNA polymerase/3'-5' exonuclease PolX